VNNNIISRADGGSGVGDTGYIIPIPTYVLQYLLQSSSWAGENRGTDGVKIKTDDDDVYGRAMTRRKNDKNNIKRIKN
jgi:hypothetical protein